MKNVLNTLLVSSIVLGGSTLGVVANAAGTTREKPTGVQEGNSAGYVEFEKGDLSFVNKDVNDKQTIVPTFDFIPGRVGVETNNLPLKDGGKTDPKNNENIAVADTVGVADYTGESKGWNVSVEAGQFTNSSNEEATTKAAKDKLETMTINFSIKINDVTGEDGKKFAIAGEQKETVEVEAKAGSTSTTIFKAPVGDESAGKFIFDYSGTTLSIPQKAASEAKSNVNYKSKLTWKLQQNTDTKALQAAVPAK